MLLVGDLFCGSRYGVGSPDLVPVFVKSQAVSWAIRPIFPIPTL